MNILVTGANGQLGKCIYDEVYKENRIIIPNNTKWFFCGHSEVDICDYEELESFIIENNIDVIINCAAYTNVEKAEVDKEACFNINVNGIKNLASVSNTFGVFIIHISTDYVFDGARPVPYKEGLETYPINYYGLTKYFGEKELINNASEYIIVRTSLLYSEYGDNIFTKTLKILKEKEECMFTIDQVTSPTYARDLAYTIILLLSYTHRNCKEIFNFCNNGVVTRYDFANTINELYFNGKNNVVIKPCKSNAFPSNVSRPAYSVLDNSLIDEELELQIPYWRDSLKKCVDRIKKETD